MTVFGGDEELGLGPDEEAIEIWKAHGVPEERIVLLPRSENFWQAGADRALRPVLGDVPRPRAASSAGPTSAPATTPTASSSTGTTSS